MNHYDTPEVVAQIFREQLNNLPAEQLNSVVRIDKSFEFPFPNITQTQIIADIVNVGKIWIEMKKLNKIKGQEEIGKLIGDMPTRWQKHLRNIIIDEAVDDILQLRGRNI